MSVTTMFWILTLFQNNYAPQHFMYVFCIFVVFIKILNNNNFFEIKKNFLSFPLQLYLFSNATSCDRLAILRKQCLCFRL